MGRYFRLHLIDRVSGIKLIRNAFYLLPICLLLYSCQQESLQSPAKSKITHIKATPLEDISTYGQVDNVNVTVRSDGPGYIAEAKCSGFIPAGEYAGQRFVVTIVGCYSGLGLGTLVSGSASVKIRGERFDSFNDGIFSFCCGEGYIQDMGTHYEFVVHGLVEHTTAPILHNHLFSGLGSTLGTMNFGVEDQTGTITEGPPAHDPGIGLILDIPAHPVTVTEVP